MRKYSEYLLALLFLCSTGQLFGQNTFCNADFSSTVSGNTASFTDNSTASSPIISYQWTFGDGSFAYTANPSHNYAQAGTYQACLSIETADSCWSSHCDTIVVQGGGGGPGCQAQFNTTQSNASSFQFNNTSSANGTITSYLWDFGDGSYSAQTNPTYTYAGPGTYNVCLCIYDANNVLCDIACQTVVIGNGCNINAAFSYTVTGNVVAFQNQSTGTNNTTIYDWYFGDNTYSNQENPIHTYQGSGTPWVTLFAYDSLSNCSDSTSVLITTVGPGRTTGGTVIPRWTVSSFPNPAVSVSNLRYTLNKASPVSIRVFNITGKVVAQPVNGEAQSVGEHAVKYDTGQLPSGIYLYEIQAGEERITTRFVKN